MVGQLISQKGLGRREFIKTLGAATVGVSDVRAIAAGYSETVRVAAIVVRWVRFGDYKEPTSARVSALVREAAKNGAKIACTTECFLDGYHTEVSDRDYQDVYPYLEDVTTSRYVQGLKELAKELSIYIVAGKAVMDSERKDQNGNPRPFNTAQLYSPEGELAGIYSKTHNFNRRSPWFDRIPADDKASYFPAFDTNVGRLGMMICNDRKFSESTRWLAENGAECILCPTGGAYSYEMLADRSRETKVGIVWVHPCGYAASSPGGKIIARAGYAERSRSVSEEELDGPNDHRHIFYVDLPVATIDQING